MINVTYKAFFLHTCMHSHITFILINSTGILDSIPPSTIRSAIVCLTVAHLLLRWPNIKPLLAEPLVFAGKSNQAAASPCPENGPSQLTMYMIYGHDGCYFISLNDLPCLRFISIFNIHVALLGFDNRKVNLESATHYIKMLYLITNTDICKTFFLLIEHIFP